MTTAHLRSIFCFECFRARGECSDFFFAFFFFGEDSQLCPDSCRETTAIKRPCNNWCEVTLGSCALSSCHRFSASWLSKPGYKASSSLMTDIFYLNVSHSLVKGRGWSQDTQLFLRKRFLSLFNCIISTRHHCNTERAGAASLWKDTFPIPNKCETNGVTPAVFLAVHRFHTSYTLSFVSSCQQ